MATTAPQTLLDARRLLLNHLDINPGKVVSTDLDPAEVGIVPDAAHRGGYHCGADRVISNDYSVVESSRDRTGLTSYACALDVGAFSVRSGGATHTLRTFSTWLVAQCAAGTADTRDIREVIYSPDGSTVRRWDRLGRRSSGDSSHLWHTHISYHRDAIRAGRDQTAVFRRYLTTIGLIQGDDMPLTKADIPIIREALHGCEIGRSGVTMGAVLDLMRGMPSQVAAVRADVAALAGRDLVDEQQVAVQLAPLVLAGLSPERIAAAIPAELARQVADELAARLAA
ncbi:hypothetical protein CO540_13370 [Micromonospora sp. WMMA2032]|uniref:hypothetical protein n=1 Tax=Micromonospora sp. WMMA2032 TaxID=2039870 RepID=UPI000C05B02A|nr:hypothetical protein [Micromonospora sp. WMMA2032]ATO17826.1 hypothetical protein CO540_13370 [Micromonospora sp. WMMA2032]